MNEILPSENAKLLCSKWMDQLDNCSLGDYLRTQNNGKMLGILICSDNTVLKAYSGDIESSFVSDGFVPKCFNQNQMDSVLKESVSSLEKEPDPAVKTLISREYTLKVMSLYSFCCFDGKVRNLVDICPNPRAGTGDCCAPRLLSFAYSIGKKPLEMAEFFYGSGSYIHKQFYTPCNERCKPILKHILGLDIVYQDSDIVVVNKQSGLLAIEGRTSDKQDCVASRVRNLFNTIQQPCIHRLDMATSGLMVLAKTQYAHDKLCSDFENRRVVKFYKATVEGKVLKNTGNINLPLRLDVENRPRQIVDSKQGKSALTTFIKTRIVKINGKDATQLILYPHTGRTHQLRVHCAKGLEHPIIGDPLYGNGKETDTLLLHAWILKFRHPVTGKELFFCEE